MGDVAMTVPVLRALQQQHPQLRITVISRPFFEPLFQGIQNLSFFAFDAQKRHKGFLGLLRLYNDLKPLGIDAFADLHNVLRSKVIRKLFALNGKKTAQTDKGRADKTALTRAEDKIFKPLPTVFERHAKVFETLGFAIDLSQPTFPLKQRIANEVTNLVGVKDKIWIGIAPFAQYDSKVYPFDLMQEVIRQLAQNQAYKILLFGGGSKEITQLNLLASNKENVIPIAGKFQFDQEIVLISNLDLMLSMDSGNAHVAAMLGVKVITLWGATHPFAGFSPFNQPLENCLTADRTKFPLLPTSVYGNKKVVGYEEAMRTILPDQVVSKITMALNEKTPHY
jgi:ADP-heptose:LPS heptosyltransferase